MACCAGLGFKVLLFVFLDASVFLSVLGLWVQDYPYQTLEPQPKQIESEPQTAKDEAGCYQVSTWNYNAGNLDNFLSGPRTPSLSSTSQTLKPAPKTPKTQHPEPKKLYLNPEP